MSIRNPAFGTTALAATAFSYAGAQATDSLWWWLATLVSWSALSWQVAPALFAMLAPLRKHYDYKPIKTQATAEIPIGYVQGGFQTLRFGDEYPHLLVAGQPGSGKSNFLRQVIVNCILTKDPRKLKLHLVDLKAGGLEFAPFDGCEMVEDFVWTPEGAVVVLQKLLGMMENRNKMFRKAGVVKIQDFNRKYPTRAVDYRICIVDEFANLEDHKEAHFLLKRLLREARSAGIYLILCLQRPDRDTMPGYLKHALTASLCFKVRDEINSTIILGYGHPEGCKIEIPGRGLFLDRVLKEVQPMFIPGDYDHIRSLIGHTIRIPHTIEYDMGGTT